VGHSTGEHSALLLSGLVKAANEAELIDHILGVNSAFQYLQSDGDIPAGSLVAVGGADPGLLRTLVEQSQGKLHVAMDNCPHQVVLCGLQEAIDQAVKKLQERRAICQPLPFARAYHTPWFERFCEPLRSYFQRVDIGSPRLDVYSCVTASRYPSDPEAVRSLVSVQWARPVRFRETIEMMYADGVRIFIEVGPRANLTGFIDDILRGREYIAVPSNVSYRSGITQLNHLVAQLTAQGVPMSQKGPFANR
jgi:malonyl CoA-acyl carrier protein transacylase